MSYSEGIPVLWPLLPNWKRGVTETLEFRTGIIGPTRTGLRQKRRLRLAPRRTFAFEVHPHHATRRLLDNLRFSQGAREWAMPVWPDRQSLEASLPAGSTVIPCDTDGYDFAPGRYAVLRRNELHSHQHEIVQVDTVGPTGITLIEPTVSTWPAATYLYPIRMARITTNGSSAILLTNEVSTLQVTLEVSEPCDWDAYTFPTSYRGRPVWEFKTNWRNPMNFAMRRFVTSVDNETSLPSYYDFINKTFTSLNTSWRVKGRDEHSVARGVLYSLAGRYGSLWVPSYTNDLQVLNDLGAAATVMTVGYCGYTMFGQGEPGRQDIRIDLVDGTVFYRRVLAAAEVSGNEQLTIDAPLGVAVTVDQIRRISFIMLMQQSSDRVTINHLTSAEGVATLPMVFEGIIEPPGY